MIKRSKELTPKEKALQLVCKYEVYVDYSISFRIHTKMAAIVVVDELIKEHTFLNPIGWNIQRLKYWNEVKKEIELL